MNTDDPILVEQIWPIVPFIPESPITIVVAGAWKGLYLHYFAVRFPQARIIGFEPQTEAFQVARERLSNFKNVEIWNHGLGICDEQSVIGNHGSDGASLLSSAPPFSITNIKDAVLLSDFGLISLFVMNMEGYEYLLLPYLFGSKVIQRIESIAVQFHPSFCNANLRPLLHTRYGEPIYSDYPTWNYWKCR